MNKLDLINILNNLKNYSEWKCCFIDFSHKKDISTYKAYQFHFNKKDTLNSFISSSLDIFKNQINNFEEIEEYNGYIPKSSLDRIEINDEIIIDNWKKLLESLDKIESESINKNTHINAYMFYTENTSESIYLISKKNPILNFKKKNIFSFVDNMVIENDHTNLQFNRCFDFIVYNNYLYSINKNFEIFFNLERGLKTLKEKALVELKTFNLIDNFDDFSNFSSKNGKFQKFKTFSKKRLEDLEKNEKAINFLQETLKIYKNDEKFILDTELKKENFLKFICNEITKDPYEETSYDSRNSKPLKI